MVGREVELAELRERLTKGSIVLLHGAPGVGKSTIAFELLRTLGVGEQLHVVVPNRRWWMADLFEQLAPLCGAGLPRVRPVRDWSWLADARPACVLIESAELLMGPRGFVDIEVLDLLRGLAEFAPQVKVILESRQRPIERLLRRQGSWLAAQRVVGLSEQELAVLLRRLGPEDPAAAWELCEVEQSDLCARLTDGQRAGANPLAARLLALLARRRGEPVLAVLRQLGAAQGLIVEVLLREIYDHTLTEGERRALTCCALYRSRIPNDHIRVLDRAAQGLGACASLERAGLLIREVDGYRLDSSVREFARACIRGGSPDMHRVYIEPWLRTMEAEPPRSRSLRQAAVEAAYHLLKASYDQLRSRLGDALPYGEELERLLAETSYRLFRQGHFAEDRSLLKILVALDPDNPKSLRYLGERISRLEGRASERALDCFLEAFRLCPDFPPYLANIGRSRRARGEAALFVALVEGLDPEIRELAVNAHVAAILALALADLGRFEEASQLRQRWIDRGARHAALFNDEARYQHQQGHCERALALLDEAVKGGAADKYTESLRGAVLETLGRGGDASMMRQRLLDQGSCDPAIFHDEAHYLLGLGRAKRALELLDEAEKRGACTDYTISIRGKVLEDLGQGEDASALRQRHIGRGGHHAAIYNDEARYLLVLGRLPQALEVLDLADERGAIDRCSGVIRGKVLAAMGQGAQASALRRQKIEQGARNPVIFAEEALYLKGRGRAERALALLDEACDRGVYNEYIEAIRGKVLEALGRGAEASARRMRLLDEGWNIPVIFVDEARYQHQLGHLDRALKLLNEARRRGATDLYTADLRDKVIKAQALRRA